jgi:hypothetical protein
VSFVVHNDSLECNDCIIFSVHSLVDSAICPIECQYSILHEKALYWERMCVFELN